MDGTKRNEYWALRANRYNKLEWARDEKYLNAFIKAGRFRKSDFVLDVGTGTGKVAKAVAPLVKTVIGIDSSSKMLETATQNTNAGNIIFEKHDVRNLLFPNRLFTKVTARMVFHHILTNRKRAVSEIRRALNPNGLLIIGEGVPFPGTEDWYFNMMKLKEERVSASVEDLKYLLEDGNFNVSNVKCWVAKKRNVNNWLKNSAVNSNVNLILNVFREAPTSVKKKCGMICKGESILINWLHAILVASKRK